MRLELSCVFGPVWPVGSGCYSQAALPITTLSFIKAFILSSSSNMNHSVVYLFQDLDAVIGRRQLLLLLRLLLLLLL